MSERRRRRVRKRAIHYQRSNPAVLIQWIESHAVNPYPSNTEKYQLATMAGMTKHQLNDWFANVRRHINKVGYEVWKKQHIKLFAVLAGPEYNMASTAGGVSSASAFTSTAAAMVAAAAAPHLTMINAGGGISMNSPATSLANVTSGGMETQHLVGNGGLSSMAPFYNTAPSLNCKPLQIAGAPYSFSSGSPSRINLPVTSPGAPQDHQHSSSQVYSPLSLPSPRIPSVPPVKSDSPLHQTDPLPRTCGSPWLISQHAQMPSDTSMASYVPGHYSQQQYAPPLSVSVPTMNHNIQNGSSMIVPNFKPSSGAASTEDGQGESVTRVFNPGFSAPRSNTWNGWCHVPTPMRVISHIQLASQGGSSPTRDGLDDGVSGDKAVGNGDQACGDHIRQVHGEGVIEGVARLESDADPHRVEMKEDLEELDLEENKVEESSYDNYS